MLTIKSNGHGKFTMYSECESVTATYCRGNKINDHFHPYWTLEYYGMELTLHADKQTAVETAEKLLTKLLKQQLNAAQTIEMQERDGIVHGNIAVKLHELIGTNPNTLRNDLSVLLSELPLHNIQFRANGACQEGNAVLLFVTGEYCDSKQKKGTD